MTNIGTEVDYWDQRDIYWIAGIIEGEGTFGLTGYSGKNKYYYPSVAVEMKDEDIINRLHSITGIGRVRNSTRPSRPGHWSPMFSWVVSKNKDVSRLLLAVYPLLSERRQQQVAEIVPHLTSAHRTRSDKGQRRAK